MALIDCPECGGQVSDRAPTCPHCGVPIAAAAGTTATASAVADTTPDQPAAAESPSASAAFKESFSPQVQEVQPFRPRIAGRAIPIAGLLFWGGMAFGMAQHYIFRTPEGGDSPWRTAAFVMIFAGVLWFAVTEFTALVRSRRQRHMS
jgi:hypothetical protein